MSQSKTPQSKSPQSKSDASTISDMMAQAQTVFAGNPQIGAQMTQLLETQQRFLKEAQEYSEHWFARRQEATKTAMDAAKDISGDGASDPAAAMAVMSDWQKHAMERLVTDVQEWVELCSRCTGDMTKSETKTKP